MRFLIFFLFLNFGSLFAITYSLEEMIAIALDENPDILKTYEDIRQAYGFYKQKSGQFDWNLNNTFSRQHISQVSTIGQYNTGNPPVLYTNQTSLNSSVAHLFRNGINIQPSINWQKIQDNYTNITAPKQGTVQLAVTVPLLKGLGEIATAGEEIAARMEWKATFLTASYEISKIVSTIAKSYWQYIFVEQTLDILRQGLERSQSIAANVERLVELNEYAGSDRYQPYGDVAAKKNNLLAQEIQRDSVKRQLLQALRIPQYRDACVDFDIRDFPLPSIEQIRAAPSFCCLKSLAEANRLDLAGKKESLGGKNILVQQAKNQLLPTLNVQMQADTHGFIQNKLPAKNITPGPPAFPVVPAPNLGVNQHGFLKSFKKGVRQIDYTGSVVLDYPLCNLEAKGLLIQKQADYDRTFFELVSLFDQVEKDVATSLYTLQKQAERHEELKIQAEEYKKAADAEKEKMLLGYSSVINVIQLENKYLDSALSVAQQAFDYISAIIDFRLQLGLILSLGSCDGNTLITDSNLFGLPWAGAPYNGNVWKIPSHKCQKQESLTVGKAE